MIVNTQVFNYRFTIGTLIVAIIVLATYGFSNYSSLDSDNDYLANEKKLLQLELNEFINRYDELSLEKESLKSLFENTRERAQLAYDSLSLLKANVAVLSKYRAELMFLKRQNRVLQSDSLIKIIDDLEEKNEEIEETLKLKEAENAALEKENSTLEETIEEGSMLFANSFNATVYRERNSGERVVTTKASNAESVEVCFVLAENPLAKEGQKKLYIQILGPDSNVVNDKGVVNFGESSLIYSESLIVEYKNNAEEICAVIPNNESFKKGVYYVSVFENQRKLGNTQIELD